MNYHGKKFRPVSSSENSEVSHETVFEYLQEGSILTCSYSGGSIQKGQLMGIVDEHGNIEMHYHQINSEGEFMTGICHSRPEIMDDGKIRLHESWQWTSGDRTTGQSILEEI
jgi:hypothetical protein